VWQLAPVCTIFFLIIPSQNMGTNSSFLNTLQSKSGYLVFFWTKREPINPRQCSFLDTFCDTSVWEKWSLVLPWGPRKGGKLAFTVRLSVLLKHFPSQMCDRHNCTCKIYLTPISPDRLSFPDTHTFTHPRFRTEKGTPAPSRAETHVSSVALMVH